MSEIIKLWKKGYGAVNAEDLDSIFCDTILYVNGEYVKKSEAVISVYDSGVQHGDGVYEGIRAYGNSVFMPDAHLDRLYDSCKAVRIKFDMDRSKLKSIIGELVKRNLELGFDHIHMRLQVTRGWKKQTGMHTNLNISPYSLIICVDEKPPIFSEKPLKLATTWIRRYSPAYLDPKIHSCNQLNQIMAADAALRVGADEAVMLDDRGFVAETNSTNIQYIRNKTLYLPTTDCQLPGITRNIVMDLAVSEGLRVVEKNCSIAELYSADEVFLTGTAGEVAPVESIDGRVIGDGEYTYTKKLLKRYHEYVKENSEMVQ